MHFQLSLFTCIVITLVIKEVLWTWSHVAAGLVVRRENTGLAPVYNIQYIT